jgi:competence protein ComEC
MAAMNPLVLWDVGFQLSFAATLGLVLYADPFTQAFVRVASRVLPSDRARELADPVGEYVLFTLAAQLTTLPIMAYHFGRISLVSFIANPFILPVQPAVMLLAGAALLLAMLYLPLGKLAAWIALPFASYTIRAVEFFDRMPNRVIVLGEFSLLFVVLFYAVLFAWTFTGFRLMRKSALKPIPLLAGILVLTALTWRAAFALPDGKLHLFVLDVGSADTFLIETPRGRWILVNGGGKISSLSDSLGRRLAPGARHLDWLVVASTQENQLSALPRVLDRYPPSRVLWSGNKEASYESRRLRAYLTEKEIPVFLAEEGQRLDLGNGAFLDILSVTPRGAVLFLRWNAFTALLPVGMNFDALDTLQTRAKAEGWSPLSVLLLADSGYAPLSPPSWVHALQPRLVLLDVAADDPRGMPSRAALQAAEGYPLLRTDESGWIHITTDGENMWIEIAHPLKGISP